MAYTGTGTQADPYVVTTGMSLIECIRKGTGLYIKVANDIDFANVNLHLQRVCSKECYVVSHARVLASLSAPTHFCLVVEQARMMHYKDQA